jgi:hypothetical protein
MVKSDAKELEVINALWTIDVFCMRAGEFAVFSWVVKLQIL